MFLRRRADLDDAEATASTLTTVRDIVEIVAIVIAGIRAIYTFVSDGLTETFPSAPAEACRSIASCT